MRRISPKTMNSEKGQVLSIVLALLALGGLTIAVSLNYVSTGLNSGRIIDEKVKGTYAAEAGIEDALWSLKMGSPLPQQLQEIINGMEVSIESESEGIYTLYLGEMVALGVHNPYLDVQGEVVWDEGAGKYKYTVTVIWLPESGTPVIHLSEIGARLPLGYNYTPGSAALFDNLSTEEPLEIVDDVGANMVNWEFSTPKPSVSESNPVETQTFYFAGDGPIEGGYGWWVASREDIGAVGEITGNLYHLISTASYAGGGRTTARIGATVIREISENTTIKIISWGPVS